MEPDHDHHPTSEKTPDGDDQGANVVTVPRSYECNFCKRGFSNAQALGGHMNIHRRDKAKLKQQSSNPTQQHPLDNIHHHQKVNPPSMEGKSGDERSSNPSWPWNMSQQGHASSRDETHVMHMRQLPLFAELPTRSEKQKPQGGQIHEETTTQPAFLSSGQASSLELDLELRLGTEPQDSSAAASTRKFF